MQHYLKAGTLAVVLLVLYYVMQPISEITEDGYGRPKVPGCRSVLQERGILPGGICCLRS
jgi:hypothetical protein